MIVEKVIKRNGDKVEFNGNKIKKAIEKCMRDNRKVFKQKELLDIFNTVLLNVSNLNQKELDIEAIQDIVVETLFSMKKTDLFYSFTSYREKRREIRDRELGNKINDILFKSSEDNDGKRENGNVDGDTPMGTMLQAGSTVTKHYGLTRYPKYISKAHEKGDIHIHDLDFDAMGTTTCTQIDLKQLFDNGFNTGHGYLRPPRSIRTASALTAIVIQANQNSQHGGQAIPMLDYYLAPYVLLTYKQIVKEFLQMYLSILNVEDIDKYKNEIEEICENKIKSIHENNLKTISEENFTFSISEELLKNMHNNIMKKLDKEVFQSMEGLVHNLNTMHSRAGAQVPFSSINLGTDVSLEGRMVIKNLLLAQEAGLGKGETPIFPILIFKVKKGINLNEEDPNYDLFELACKVSSERLFPNFVFIDAPHNLQYYQEGRPETEAVSMGCRTRVIGDRHGDDIVTGKGNLSFTTINLPKLGILAQKDINKFYELFDKQIDLCIEQLLIRFKNQCNMRKKNFPFLLGQNNWQDCDKVGEDEGLYEILKHGSLSIGFIGLAECLIALTGKHHGESKQSWDLGYDIVKHLFDRTNMASDKYDLNFSCLGTPAEGTCNRFNKILKKEFGTGIKGITDKDYVTNSFHIPVEYKLSAKDKIDLEAPFHALTPAGHITYIELDGSARDNVSAFKSVIKYMAKSGVGYGSINHPLDKCEDCGLDGIIPDECPNCGSKKIDRIRRITGYLANKKRFNDGKRAEEKARVKHC